MTKKEQTDLLSVIRDKVMDINPEAKVILYGSRARNHAHKDSDWDILIIVPEKVTLEIEQKYSYPLYELEWLIGEVISVLVASEKDWENPVFQFTSLYQNVKAEGVVL